MAYSGVDSKLAQRDTPAGREYELKIMSWDSVALALGCIALAVPFPPLLFSAAAVHLVLGFMQTVSKLLWIAIEPIKVAVATGLLIGAVYGVQVFYLGASPASVTAHVQSHWPQLVATAIVAAGIIGQMLSGVGSTQQLVELLNRGGGPSPEEMDDLERRLRSAELDNEDLRATNKALHDMNGLMLDRIEQAMAKAGADDAAEVVRDAKASVDERVRDVTGERGHR